MRYIVVGGREGGKLEAINKAALRIILESVVLDGDVGAVGPYAVILLMGAAVVIEAPGWEAFIDLVVTNIAGRWGAGVRIGLLNADYFLRAEAEVVVCDVPAIADAIDPTVHGTFARHGEGAGIASKIAILYIGIGTIAARIIEEPHIHGGIGGLEGVIMAVGMEEGIIEESGIVDAERYDRRREAGQYAMGECVIRDILASVACYEYCRGGEAYLAVSREEVYAGHRELRCGRKCSHIEQHGQRVPRALNRGPPGGVNGYSGLAGDIHFQNVPHPVCFIAEVGAGRKQHVLACGLRCCEARIDGIGVVSRAIAGGAEILHRKGVTVTEGQEAGENNYIISHSTKLRVLII